MPGALDPTAFPLREGITVPREMVTMHEAKLLRCHGGSLAALASGGGLSVYELLLLQPPPPGKSEDFFHREIHDLTLTGAMQALQPVVAAFYKKREEDAEAAMLAQMEAEAGEPLA